MNFITYIIQFDIQFLSPATTIIINIVVQKLTLSSFFYQSTGFPAHPNVPIPPSAQNNTQPPLRNLPPGFSISHIQQQQQMQQQQHFFRPGMYYVCDWRLQRVIIMFSP